MSNTLYEYTVATDVASGLYDQSALHGEIEAGSLPGFVGLRPGTEAGKFRVEFEAALSSGEKTTLDGIVSSHQNLDYKKTQRCREIDANTETLIAKGFTYSGKIFSLSANAQRKIEAYSGQIACEEMITYPIRVSTASDEMVGLADLAALKGYLAAYHDRIHGLTEEGAKLKQDAKSATDQASLDLVADNRT